MASIRIVSGAPAQPTYIYAGAPQMTQTAMAAPQMYYQPAAYGVQTGVQTVIQTPGAQTILPPIQPAGNQVIYTQPHMVHPQVIQQQPQVIQQVQQPVHLPQTHLIQYPQPEIYQPQSMVNSQVAQASANAAHQTASRLNHQHEIDLQAQLLSAHKHHNNRLQQTTAKQQEQHETVMQQTKEQHTVNLQNQKKTLDKEKKKAVDQKERQGALFGTGLLVAGTAAGVGLGVAAESGALEDGLDEIAGAAENMGTWVENLFEGGCQ